KADLLLWDLRESALDRFERPLDVGLEHEFQLLGLALLDLREHLVERRGLLGRARARALARVRRDERFGGLLVRDDAEHIARLRDAGQAEDLDRAGRLGAANG